MKTTEQTFSEMLDALHVSLDHRSRYSPAGRFDPQRAVADAKTLSAFREFFVPVIGDVVRQVESSIVGQRGNP